MWHHSFIYLPIKVVIFIILKGSEASVAVGSEGQENYMCVIQLCAHTVHPSGLNLIFVLWRSVLRRQRSWPVFALTPHSDTHLSTPLWFSQNQKPPCLSDSEDTVPLTGPNDIDRSVKTGKEHTGGHRGQTDTKKDFIFWKPSGHLEIWDLQALWLSVKGSGSPRCAPDKQMAENRRLFTPPIIFAC